MTLVRWGKRREGSRDKRGSMPSLEQVSRPRVSSSLRLHPKT